MIFDLTANANGRKLPTLDPNYPLDQTLTFIQGNANSVTFECRIAKDGRPTQYAYQWYLDGSPVSGATGPSCTLSGFTASGTHTVSCTVTNAAGAVETRTATLTVNMYTLPALNSSYPADVSKTFIAGNSVSATFEAKIATAGNPASYTYQWYLDGSAVSGATGSSYTWTGTEGGSHTVYCKVTNAAGTVQTRTAALSVVKYYTPVLNGSYPADVSKTFIKGNSVSATFEAKISTAGNPASYTYQWYVNNAAVSGATGSSYTWTGSAAGTHTVYCKVTNAAGTVQTRVATLSVVMYYTPTLNGSYPQDAAVTVGTPVELRAAISADGNPASYSYQWYEVSIGLLEGWTNPVMYWTPESAGWIPSFYCVVTNAAGSVQTRTATITPKGYYLWNRGAAVDFDCNWNNIYEGVTLYYWYNSSANLVTLNKVPTSKYNTLKFKYRVTNVHSSGNGTVSCQVTTDYNTSTNAVVSWSVATNGLTDSSDKTVSIDISSISSDLYIRFSGWYGSIGVYEVWLE